MTKLNSFAFEVVLQRNMALRINPRAIAIRLAIFKDAVPIEQHLNRVVGDDHVIIIPLAEGACVDDRFRRLAIGYAESGPPFRGPGKSPQSGDGR